MSNRITQKLGYNLSNQHASDFGCVTADNEIIYKIKSIDEFYKVLGYTTEMQKAGIEYEFYVWEHFRKNNCPHSSDEFQLKLLEYLIQHCPTCREKLTVYG